MPPTPPETAPLGQQVHGYHRDTSAALNHQPPRKDGYRDESC